ncbi:respiratory chain complex I subunit 1 family protein [Desulfobacterium sp. N47]|uniref:respiratory chain complex I subunit 1 family protein n=1 Tax=Desulfobacterium sp. N47 TaxID=3115210 RepID=UPI003C94B560
MTITASVIHLFLALILSPLLMGIINRTKALFAGRKGQPLLQPYYDLIKLMKKGAVYSTTSSWVFRLGPVLGLAAVMISIMIVPAGGIGGMLSFPGDFVFMAYALGLTRFVTVLAAMDTGSAFEGMGASREVQFAIIAEVVLLLGLAVLAVGTQEISLAGIYAGLWTNSISTLIPVTFLVAFAFLIVLLTENARIPVDDPNTHLELTMIHEVMVLDHGGVDLAFIQYGASLKLWLFSALLAGIAIPLRTGLPLMDMIISITGILVIAMLVGIIESCMARLKLLHVPQMLVVALSVTVAALLWIMR